MQNAHRILRGEMPEHPPRGDVEPTEGVPQRSARGEEERRRSDGEQGDEICLRFPQITTLNVDSEDDVLREDAGQPKIA